MNSIKTNTSYFALMLAVLGVAGVAEAAPFTQCPGDDYMLHPDQLTNPGQYVAGNDSVPDPFIVDLGTGLPTATPNPSFRPEVKCMHLGAGDGFVRMSDDQRYLQYMFSFMNLTGTDSSKAMETGFLAAQFPAPAIVLDEGQQFYLSLTNVGMANRPDLSDPHTVHFHGFPQASDTFDGVPDATISINMGSTLTYFYNIVEPGTYMYHCHVEATEHMQMGMLGNLYVHAGQDKTAPGTLLGAHTHTATDRYVYNDGDGTTRYDVEVPIQLSSFDSNFHDASMTTQPLPFANMKDNYVMLNGRGYPDTVNPAVDAIPAPAENGGQLSQQENALVEATAGQTILLRLSNLNVTNHYTLRILGLDMTVVGRGARLQRGPDGKDLYYTTNHVQVGPGEGIDVLIDTNGVTPGTYYLYSTNLNFLTNNQEEFGGAMTEIRIAAAPPAI